MHDVKYAHSTPYKTSAQILRCTYHSSGSNVTHDIIYFLSGQEARARRVAELLQQMNAGQITANRGYHTELGELLGYSPEEIAEFNALD